MSVAEQPAPGPSAPGRAQVSSAGYRPEKTGLVLMSAEPVRHRIRELQRSGMSLSAVAEASGVAPSTLDQILHGDPARAVAAPRRVPRATLRAILAVRVRVEIPDGLPPVVAGAGRVVEPFALEDVPGPGPWVLEGACADLDVDLFFPGPGQHAGPAREVCASCPVMAPCRSYALWKCQPHLAPP